MWSRWFSSFVHYECLFQCARLSTLQTLLWDMLGTEQCSACGCLLMLQVLLTLYPIPASKEWSHYADRMAFGVKTSSIQSHSPLFEFEAISPCPIAADTCSVAEPCTPGRLCQGGSSSDCVWMGFCCCKSKPAQLLLANAKLNSLSFLFSQLVEVPDGKPTWSSGSATWFRYNGYVNMIVIHCSRLLWTIFCRNLSNPSLGCT